jgi:hypothetical protein
MLHFTISWSIWSATQASSLNTARRAVTAWASMVSATRIGLLNLGNERHAPFDNWVHLPLQRSSYPMEDEVVEVGISVHSRGGVLRSIAGCHRRHLPLFTHLGDGFPT